jgi:hypothetical protein
MPEAPNAVRELAEDATSRKRFLGGIDPTKGPFDMPLGKPAVLKAVTPLIKS